MDCKRLDSHFWPSARLLPGHCCGLTYDSPLCLDMVMKLGRSLSQFIARLTLYQIPYWWMQSHSAGCYPYLLCFARLDFIGKHDSFTMHAPHFAV
jgi:hypothetical protein